jgi:hypothetical protein
VGIGQQGNSRYAEGIQDDWFVCGYPFLHRGGSSFAKVHRQVTNEPTSVVITNFVDTVVEGLDLLAKFEFGKQGLLSHISTVDALFVLIPQQKEVGPAVGKERNDQEVSNDDVRDSSIVF